ncbi:hypothetical protein Pst134EA_027117 [Puccinia striiformis f. sp. tritici]|uniref:hypothetical protein n=1 Tax=Puccinia striiformis f. sp. tritici TaxID=168172 RepID=UPI002007706B|nr:hypothetical protein Pst134EA_027117 [Puccinia striiformis f. sp. tritici]KAH9450416.1 hypothetical protein Pst134EA_027117 [Puccinia striiformis f. sp. tritici]
MRSRVSLFSVSIRFDSSNVTFSLACTSACSVSSAIATAWRAVSFSIRTNSSFASGPLLKSSIASYRASNCPGTVWPPATFLKAGNPSMVSILSMILSIRSCVNRSVGPIDVPKGYLTSK